MSDTAIEALRYSEFPNSSDCISRQAAIDEIDEWIKAFLEIGHKESAADARLIQDGIIQLPSAQPQRMRGRWIKSDTDGFVCSVCRNGYKMQPTIMGEPMFEFCPCCGAQMDGGEQNE